MTATERGSRKKTEGNGKTSHTQREIWTSWLGLVKGRTGRWTKNEPGWKVIQCGTGTKALLQTFTHDKSYY